MSKKVRLLRAFILVGALGFTIYFALFERFLPLDLPEFIRGSGDHHLHMLAFFCLTVIFLFGSRSVVWPLILAVVVAIVLETLQMWLPDRGANLDDLRASLKGVGLGFAVMWSFYMASRWFRRTPRYTTN